MSMPSFFLSAETLLTLRSIRYYLSERFRLRFEDSGLEDIMDENGQIHADDPEAATTDEAIDLKAPPTKIENLNADPASNPFLNGEIRTLDGDIAGDEFAADAINYQVLLNKIDTLLEKLKLDA